MDGSTNTTLHRVVLGKDKDGADVCLDIARVLEGRLLIQGNSGAGKSWLLRRLLERSWGMVQQIVIDPDGEFVTLVERFEHIVVPARDLARAGAGAVAAAAREHRFSLIVDLSDADPDERLWLAKAFLDGLLDCPDDAWRSVIVVVDEAQLLAPWGVGADRLRKECAAAVGDLMSRGRKRGLAGIIASSRLAQLAKTVASQAANLLIGMNVLDIDAARASSMIGLGARQQRVFQRLSPGTFIAVGPALRDAPTRVKVGPVETKHKGASPVLEVPPAISAAEAAAVIARLPAIVDEPPDDAARKNGTAWPPPDVSILRDGYQIGHPPRSIRVDLGKRYTTKQITDKAHNLGLKRPERRDLSRAENRRLKTLHAGGHAPEDIARALKVGIDNVLRAAAGLRLRFAGPLAVPHGVRGAGAPAPANSRPLRASEAQVLDYLRRCGTDIALKCRRDGFIVDRKHSYDLTGLVRLANKRRMQDGLAPFVVEAAGRSNGGG